MSTMQKTKLVEGVAVDVTKVQHVADYKIRLTFSDGFERELDLGPFLRASSNEQIRAYLDPGKFAQFTLKDGELMWGDYELCFPIADLYEGAI
jgi:hypothetical protein